MPPPVLSRTSEKEWLAILKDLPIWDPPPLPTIIVSPHPDDETLGVGGLIADLRRREMDVTVIAVTDGENAYPDMEMLGPVREKEQTLALEKLGVSCDKIKRLRITDSSVQMYESQLTQQIKALASPHTHLIAPWFHDFHPDHESVGRVVTKIAEQVGAKLTYYFFWTWHQGTLASVRHLPLGIYPLDSVAFAAKQQALSCHLSQLAHSSGEPILPEYLLAPARRHFEVYLPIW